MIGSNVGVSITNNVSFQWAKIIISIERSVPPETAKTYLEEYSIKLSKTERGVMVIKTKDKTRASQRKGALSNWKVSQCSNGNVQGTFSSLILP